MMIRPSLMALVCVSLGTASSIARDPSKYRFPSELAKPGLILDGVAGRSTRNGPACRVILAEVRGEDYVRLLVTSPRWPFIGYVYEGSLQHETDKKRKPFLRFRRVASMPLGNPMSGLKQSAADSWHTLLALGARDSSEIHFRWDGRSDDGPGEWIGQTWFADQGQELWADQFHIWVKPIEASAEALDASAFKTAWPTVIDGRAYEGKWFNWSSNGSPVRVEFDRLAPGDQAALTIQNYESRASYVGKLDVTDANANGYALTMSMYRVLKRESGRRVGRIVGGDSRVTPGNAARSSIQIAFRLGEDRKTLYGVNEGGNILVLHPTARRPVVHHEKRPIPSKRERPKLTPEQQASRDLKLAKMYLRSTKPSSRRVGKERLRRLVSTFPGTDAASAASELLVGGGP